MAAFDDDELFAWLCTRYVQNQDSRQKSMGLQYMSAETHDMAEAISRRAQAAATAVARPRADWHDDDGALTWWRFEDGKPLGEAAWLGQPNDSDWPLYDGGGDYYTHWTPHPVVPTLFA